MSSVRVAAAERILDLIAGHENIETTEGRATRLTTHRVDLGVGVEVIHLGDIRAVDVKSHGFTGPEWSLEWRDTFEVGVWCVVTRPGDTADDARRRCGELVDAVMETITANKVLGRDTDPHPSLAGVAHAVPSDLDGPHSDLAQEGYLSVARIGITVVAQRLNDY